jgi:hypothetical protein
MLLPALAVFIYFLVIEGFTLSLFIPLYQNLSKKILQIFYSGILGRYRNIPISRPNLCVSMARIFGVPYK